MAQRLGVSKALPGHWERGVKTPSLGKIEAVAKLLSVSVSWLMDDRIGKGPSEDDDQEPTNPASILSDYRAPPGLRDLASNKELVSALDITADGWISLRSLKAPPEFMVHGYVAVLMAIRGNVTES